jgi:hypothetical protein
MLSNVQEITGYLLIYISGYLTNVDGLRSLTNIGGFLQIDSNDVLTTIAGLRNLKAIRGLTLYGDYGISFYNNAALTTSLSFPALTCKGGTVYCGSTTPACTTAAFNTLSSKPACDDECAVGIHNCAAGTSTCTNTVSSFTCACNAGFTGNGVACPTYMGDVFITTQAGIASFTTALSNVFRIVGNVGIGCVSSSNCPGSPITAAQLIAMLSNVQEITGPLLIYSNAALTSVEDLRSLTSIGWYLYTVKYGLL